MGKLAIFFQEVRSELRKVTWPTREEAIHYTAMVVVVSGAIAIFLGALDYGFQFILNNFVL